MNFANIRDIDTTGASKDTVNGDGTGQSAGKEGSRNMAKADLFDVNKIKESIKKVGREEGVDPAVIAGIISRESRGGKGLDSKGWGDHGNAYGVMQVDKNWHAPQGGPSSEEHIRQGAKILKGCYDEIGKKYPCWTVEQRTKGALAAYNKGASRVSSYDGVDDQTTGKDYSNDVVARAQLYKDSGY